MRLNIIRNHRPMTFKSNCLRGFLSLNHRHDKTANHGLLNFVEINRISKSEQKKIYILATRRTALLCQCNAMNFSNKKKNVWKWKIFSSFLLKRKGCHPPFSRNFFFIVKTIGNTESFVFFFF